MKIQGVVRASQGCDYHRVVLPLIYLNKDTEWCKDNTIEVLWVLQQEHLIDCDILIYNKFIATPVQALKEMQQQGMKIIVDVDDMWVLPTWHPNYRQWHESGSDRLTEEHIRIADLVTCTSIALQEEIRKINKNTAVIPNALPFGQGLYQPSYEASDKMRFLYTGGVTHLQDVELLSGKFQKIGGDPFIKDKSEFILAGYEKAKKRVYKTQQDLNAGNNNYTIEEHRGPYDTMKGIFASTNSYRIIPTAPVTEYIKCYDHADVVLVPMVENSWNSYKSILKILEAASRKIPCIVSSVAPYAELRPCEGIMWVENQDQWIEYVRWCIRNPDKVKEMGEQLYNWVSEEHNLTLWNNTRKELFKSLI